MILFSDFDDTLYFRDEPEKTAQNLAAIKKWKATGNQFCITTGRSYKSITTNMPEIGALCDFYILDSGSIILNSKAEFMHAFCFPPKLVADIVNFSKTLPEIPIAVYYTPSSEGYQHTIENVTKLRLWFADTDLFGPVLEKLSNLPVAAFECQTISNHKELAGYNGFIEIIPENSGKSNAISFLSQAEGFRPKNIITLGDGLNDYGMIKDFNGYMIEGSPLSKQYGGSFKSIPSLAVLVSSL